MSESSPNNQFAEKFANLYTVKGKPELNTKITDSNDVKVETFASILMSGSELIRDLRDNPGDYDYSRSMIPNATINTEPEAWVFSHIGDIHETAVLFTATRLSLTIVDQLLKKATKNKMGIPDEAGFWLSLAVGTLLPSLYELNNKLPFHLFPPTNSSSDPADLFGIGVAAVVLIVGHYSRDALEQVKNIKSKRVDNGMAV